MAATTLALAALVLGALALAGCGPSVNASAPGVVNAIGAENEYADVISQIGGDHVHVSSILNNPNTDPHSFESSPSVAREVSAAELIVQNGVGYDDFMNKIEAASPSSTRQVIVVAHVLGLPGDTANPHLWYDPATMPTVADAVARDLATLDPAHAADGVRHAGLSPLPGHDGRGVRSRRCGKPVDGATARPGQHQRSDFAREKPYSPEDSRLLAYLPGSRGTGRIR